MVFIYFVHHQYLVDLNKLDRFAMFYAYKINACGGEHD